MADITFTGNKKLKTINKEWCEKFPYLYISFFGTDGNAVGDWTLNHSVVRAKKDSSELKTTGNMHVGTFESRYMEAFGTPVEIKYVKGGKKFRTLKDKNDLTLTQMNEWAKTQGASVIMDTHPEWFK